MQELLTISYNNYSGWDLCWCLFQAASAKVLSCCEEYCFYYIKNLILKTASAFGRTIQRSR